MIVNVTRANHPALVGFSEVIPLSGFSGALVAVLRTTRGNRFVRKVAIDAATNLVLRSQARRQLWLREKIMGSVNIPDVLGDGECEGLYYFDMPLIPGRDAVTFLSTAPFDELRDFATRIETLMATLARAEPSPSHVKIPTKAALLSKLDEISERTSGRFSEALNPLYNAIMALARFSDVNNERPTAVHGDLTFENILVGRGGQLWLIDSIESPVDHYWLDWSKLFQECEGRWHAYRGRPIPTSVTWWLRTRWMSAATRQAPLYPSRHYILLGLTFARILPYTLSESDDQYVSGRVLAFGNAALAAIKKE